MTTQWNMPAIMISNKNTELMMNTLLLFAFLRRIVSLIIKLLLYYTVCVSRIFFTYKKIQKHHKMSIKSWISSVQDISAYWKI